MGRWLKNLEETAKAELTKLTQSSVGFVSTNLESLHKNIIEEISMIDFVKKCCGKLPVEAQQVINGLLSSNDEQDIVNGNVLAESLYLHIELWLQADQPYYSGKIR